MLRNIKDTGVTFSTQSQCGDNFIKFEVEGWQWARTGRQHVRSLQPEDREGCNKIPLSATQA
jgi:hypothetical protein